MFKKKTLGFTPKLRTLDEINQDYNFHATQAGHKQRIINEIKAEVDGHLLRLSQINQESKTIKETPAAPPAAPVENGAE